MGALSLAAVGTRMRRHAFESGVETVRHALLLARVHAQESRRPVEVLWRLDRERLEAGFFDPREAASGPERDEDGGDREAARALLIAESWARPELPRGLRLVAARGAEGGNDTTASEGAEGDVPDGEAPEDEPPDDRLLPGHGEPGADEAPSVLRLAVFLPDGSALAGKPVWIDDGEGRRARLSIDPWTGLPAIETEATP